MNPIRMKLKMTATMMITELWIPMTLSELKILRVSMVKLTRVECHLESVP